MGSNGKCTNLNLNVRLPACIIELAMTIETERLILFPLTSQSLRDMIRNKKQTAEELGWVYSSAELSSQMCFIYQLKARNIDEDESYQLFYTYWAIVLKSSNELIGEIGFKGAPDEVGEVEVGYGLSDEKWHNNGYMTEALKALAEWAFSQDEVLAVIADTEKTNIASQKVLQKAGLLFWKEEFDCFWWKRKRF